MQSNVHTINKQVFEFQCLRAEHAFEIRNRFDHHLQEKLSGIIDQACDNLNNDENNLIAIERMEIDLGTIYFGNLEEEILWSFGKKFPEKLAEYKKLSGPLASGTEILKEELALEIVQHFLLTGRLPWFAGKPEEKYLENIFDEIFFAREEEFRKFILSNLDSNKFIERLAFHITDSSFDRVINSLELNGFFEDIKAALGSIITELILFLRSETNRLYSDNVQIPEGRIESLENRISNWLIHLQHIEASYKTHPDELTLEFILKLCAGKNDISTIEKFCGVFEELLTGVRNDALAIPEFFWQKNEQVLLKLSEAIVTIKKQLLENKVGIGVGKQKTQLVEKEARFYIFNAGLILVANYLPAFFDQLGLLDEGNFINKANQIKAVFLLHYLCSEKEQITEYIVPLNKILCGLLPDEPTPQNFFLSDEEKFECAELLNALIQNWQKVGNMSIEGFRGAFLNRDGILVLENGQWILKIERRGYDILLDSLPWSFNYTRLKWMQNLILTEW
jgi:Contractile injection system tape measure protein